jgi:SAM-dependent methyltransferase
MSTPVLCNLCGVDDATVVFGPGVAQISQIVRCNRCGLMYASPRAKAPDHVEVASYDPEWGTEADDPQKHEKERLQVKDYDKTRALLGRLYPNRGKLLEIGSSLGFLLAEFKRDGWDVVGLEPRTFACRYTREKHGIEALNAILEEAGIPDESVDVVLLNHVIEHMDDPLRTLREINRVLKPNGHFVMETPRYDTLIFKLLGRRERSINCEGHIYFFTTDTLRKLYEAAGFRTVATDYVGRSLTLDRLMYNVGVVSKNDGVKRALGGIARALKLQNVRLYLNMRDMQHACVQKTAAAAPAIRAVSPESAVASAAAPAT